MPVALVVGRWRSADYRLCVEVFADHTLDVAVDGPGYRHPVRISGRYVATEAAGGAARVRVARAKVVQKQLTRCRKSWADTTVPRTEVLGVSVRSGGSFALTFRILDDGAVLEVCGARGRCERLPRIKPSGRKTAGDKS